MDGRALRILLTDTGKDDHVCVHGHTDTEDHTGDTGKREHNIIQIDQRNHDRGIKSECDGGCNTHHAVDHDHKDHHDHKADACCNKGSGKRLRSEGSSHDLVLQLLQGQIDGTDPDKGRQIFRCLKALHTGNDALSVRDRILYGRNADEVAVIENTNGLAILISLGSRFSEGSRPRRIQGKGHDRLFISELRILLVFRSGICHGISVHNKTAVCLQLFYRIIQNISAVIGIKGVALISCAVGLRDEVQRTGRPQIPQHCFCIRHTGDLDRDPVFSFLIHRVLIIIGCGTFFHLADGIVDLLLRGIGVHDLIGHGHTAGKIQTQLDIALVRLSQSVHDDPVRVIDQPSEAGKNDYQNKKSLPLFHGFHCKLPSFFILSIITSITYYTYVRLKIQFFSLKIHFSSRSARTACSMIAHSTRFLSSSHPILYVELIFPLK